MKDEGTATGLCQELLDVGQDAAKWQQVMFAKNAARNRLRGCALCKTMTGLLTVTGSKHVQTRYRR